jgi:glyoxylase-like metal-dependent hydrolase (beta-lactamase superfamily II)
MTDSFSVVAVRYGTLETTLADAYYRWSAYGEPDGPARLDYYFWILRSDDETILVDTGFHPEAGARRGRTTLIEPAEAMAQLGIGAESVSRVLLTHLHYDHTGNLDVLPDAELLVPAIELDFWLSPMGQRGQFAGLVEAAELERVRAAEAEGRVRRLIGGEEIAPDVHAVHLGGHSPGQMALAIFGERAPVILASDAAHFYDELDHERPFAVIADLAEMYEGYDTLRELAGAEGHIVPGHDPAVMQRYPRTEGDFAVRIRPPSTPAPGMRPPGGETPWA